MDPNFSLTEWIGRLLRNKATKAINKVSAAATQVEEQWRATLTAVIRGVEAVP